MSGALFRDRLAAARRLVTINTAQMAAGMADQVEAASGESFEALVAAGVVLALVQPDRKWHFSTQDAPTDEVKAHLVAGILGCVPCVHLRRGGPQPAMAALPLRRVDCRRCTATKRLPPKGDADRCDLCGRRDVQMFVPFTATYGPVLVGGDLCPDCADVLGCVREEAS